MGFEIVNDAWMVLMGERMIITEIHAFNNGNVYCTVEGTFDVIARVSDIFIG